METFRLFSLFVAQFLLLLWMGWGFALTVTVADWVAGVIIYIKWIKVNRQDDGCIPREIDDIDDDDLDMAA